MELERMGQHWANKRAELRARLRFALNTVLTSSCLAPADVRPNGETVIEGQAVPVNPERVDWMPSPPLAPEPGAIDLNHLERMTLGDAELEREVLSMFAEQALRLIDMIHELPAEAGPLTHTLKGSARGIGAFAVAEAAARLEVAIRNRDRRESALAELKCAVAEARMAIEGLLRRA